MLIHETRLLLFDQLNEQDIFVIRALIQFKQRYLECTIQSIDAKFKIPSNLFVCVYPTFRSLEGAYRVSLRYLVRYTFVITYFFHNPVDTKLH